MLGHGTPYGLINVHRGGYFINYSHAELLRSKETYSIWCWSDEFFRKFHLHGFHTGMIISEVDEEYFILGRAPLSDIAIYGNMVQFAQVCGESETMEPEQAAKYVKDNYIGNDEVTRYNRGHIYVT